MTEPAAEASQAPEPGGPSTEPASAELSIAGSSEPNATAAKRRRRGSRGGRGRGGTKSRTTSDEADVDGDDELDEVAEQPATASTRAVERAGTAGAPAGGGRAPSGGTGTSSTSSAGGAGSAGSTASTPARRRTSAKAAQPEELPERLSEGRIHSPEVAERVLVKRPRIGDTKPAPDAVAAATHEAEGLDESADVKAGEPAKRRKRGARGKGGDGVKKPAHVAVQLDEATLERRRGRERKGRPVGRYLMAVHVTPNLTQIAVLEGRNLIEHYVSRPADDVSQIHGNIYLGRVQNVLPGMEAAFVDIATPKNAVLYRGDVQYDAEDLVESGGNGNKKGQRPRIEQMLRARQMIVCQVTKNPIGAKGARLTQEVSLPGRFVVLIPNSKTYGISKRLPDDERKRLRSILDKVKPAEHGVIVRTAAENVVEEELRADVQRLLDVWSDIEARAKRASGPTLLYREPDMAVRVIREEFNREYRGVVIDDRAMFDEVKGYVEAISPALADRVEHYDAAAEGLPLFERHHVHEQLHKALDRKVWLPSGGSLIIEHTEALTVIDVNTGKNVGTSNLEETVFHNNLEAAEEIARQLRLRDVGGIIVIDFIDMELKENRQKVVGAFRDALARDKTRTQVFDISDLGLVEMTRKRIGEGLLTSFADPCPMCDGRGVVIDKSLLD
jgi:ribonuclease E